MSRHILHVLRVHQKHFKTSSLQDLIKRNPEHSSGFHRNRTHTVFLQPVSQFVKVPVKVPNDRTGSAARSAGTATNISSAPISTPAGSGCNTGNIRLPPLLFCALFLAISDSLLLGSAAQGYETSKLLNGIAAVADVTTDL